MWNCSKDDNDDAADDEDEEKEKHENVESWEKMWRKCLHEEDNADEHEEEIGTIE